MIRKLAVVVVCVAGLTFLYPATAEAGYTVNWTGKGLRSVRICDYETEWPHLTWILTNAQPAEGTTVELFINGHNAGAMTPDGPHGALQITFHAPPWFSFEMLEEAIVFALVPAGSLGRDAVLTVGDSCVCRYD